MKKAHGFTIVELLIVIVVIAILAAVTAVTYGGATTRAKDTSKLAEVKQFIKRIELYKAEHGLYPLPVSSAQTAIYATHVASNSADSVYFVVNRKGMSTKEIQKLDAFQSDYGIDIPSGVLYYYDAYDRQRNYAFVMASFLDDKNIPEENRSYRLKEGATNTMFPQLVTYTYGTSAACNNIPQLEASQPQSTTGLGDNDLPLLIDSSIYMNHRTIYNNINGCNSVGYVRDTYSGGVGYTRTSGTGLFPLKSYSL